MYVCMNEISTGGESKKRDFKTPTSTYSRIRVQDLAQLFDNMKFPLKDI